MNLDHQRFFFISGFISFFLLGVIASLFVWQVVISTTPQSFAMTQSDVISISLDQSSLVAKEPVQKAVESVEQPDKAAEMPQEPEKSEQIEKTPDISDLFSTVKTTNSPSKTKENAKQLSELNALEQKVLSTKRNSQLSDKVKNIDLARSGVQIVANSGSSGPIVNEYNAKIQEIIYTNFHPASGTEGFSARVRLSLSPAGKVLSYRVISYSGSAVFNAEVDWLKERLKQIVLPAHPQGKEATFEIILTAKE